MEHASRQGDESACESMILHLLNSIGPIPVSRPALNVSDYRSHEEQEAAIESYLTWRNGKRRISVANYSTRKCAA